MFKIQQQLQKMYDDYLLCKQDVTLNTIMEYYKTEFVPIRKQLFKMKYDISEIEVQDIGDNNESRLNILHQYETNPYDVYIHYGEQPQVQKFIY